MDPLTHEMAGRIPAGVNLTDPSAVAQALHAAGYRPKVVTDLLDSVISIAIAERDAAGDSYGATNAILDCVATAAIFTAGTAGFFIANVLDGALSAALAAPFDEFGAGIAAGADLFATALLCATGVASLLWLATWSCAWRSQPARVKARRRAF